MLGCLELSKETPFNLNFTKLDQRVSFTSDDIESQPLVSIVLQAYALSNASKSSLTKRITYFEVTQ
ncbi:6295_t:CDS:2 [Acaulospora colombiana]|uniref:6295_t:CDS:1 n=1 Tax=Acaulospora colombiana TaxID=27376 RepID=A0ACA9K7P7_9GLOM|nr:6295_t:CDS:2 [Acaulospora colombiana]